MTPLLVYCVVKKIRKGFFTKGQKRYSHQFSPKKSKKNATFAKKHTVSTFFIHLFQYFQKRPVFLWGLFLLMVGGCVFLASKIRFVEDIGSFLPQNEENKRINYAYQHLGAANKIVVSIAPSNSSREHSPPLEGLGEGLTDAAAYFAEILAKNDTSNHIKDLLYEIDPQQITSLTNFLVSNMPYFLSEADYRRMDTLLSAENIEEQLSKNKQLLLSPMGTFVRNVLMADPLHFSNAILQGLDVFQFDDQYHLEDGFIFNKDGTEAIVTITSAYPVSETSQNKLLAENIQNAIDETKQHFDNQVDITAFGAALVSITNAQQIKKDSLFAVALALIFILALLIYFFRSARSLFLIAFSILFGGVFALGMIVLFKDTVSIIAVGIASIIIGIAVNYPLHFLAHLRHERNREQTIKEIVTPLLIGNITTVGAFLSLLFISSDAMKDLGLFASCLLAGTILFVLVFLPHFCRDGARPVHSNKDEAHPVQEKKLAFGRLASFSPEKNKWIVGSVLILTVIFFFFSFNTSFETNMHAINYMTQEQQQQFEKLLKEQDINKKTVYCVAEGRRIEDALLSYEKTMNCLNNLLKDSIITQNGIGIYLPSKQMQQHKINLWNNFWEDKRTPFLDNLTKIAVKQGYNAAAFDGFKSILMQNYQVQPLEYFAVIQNNLGENYLSITPEKSMVFTVLQLDKEHQQAVEKQLNSIDEQVFAFDNSSVTDRMVNALSNDFNYVLFICGFIVFFFLLFSFGRIELTLLAFIPLAAAWVWILGMMSVFGMKFNIVNIILATFIFGQGDDYTIFVTEGLLHEYTYRKKMLASFKNSLILSAVIMFLGIGMLIFAKHPAMRSLAEVTIVGMVSVLLMAYIFPPLLFNILTKKKGKPRLMPITLWNFTKTVISFIIFLIGSIILTITGFLLLTLCGKTKKHKYKYHQILCVTFRILAKIMIQVPFKVLNPHREKFDKPAILISNHQSHIDLLYILMLSPKLITLTNDWVWKSPFYGWIIRYADFLPVVNGIEQHVDRLEELVKDGYSILVFPEATRSKDCSIGRFHKGAFYLADKLKLDIIPLVVHGIGHVLPKTEFMLRKGQVHIEIGERIPPNHHLRKDKTILDISKTMRTLYKKRYETLATQIETTDYFKDKVYHNYIYKGPTIARRARKNLKRCKDYQTLISRLPDTGKILITNCGQGEFPLLCALIKKNLTITAAEQDKELFSIAKNCISIPANLSYLEQIEGCEGVKIIL